ncbi:MAG: hypothetical protein SVX43_09535, partial [Cyanobacteriota bacterium]|nr:hypothetical protein [Cyanobacteriota bacterium]
NFLPSTLEYSPQNWSLEQLASTWRMGVLFIALSLPLLILYCYRNWPGKKRLLPYWKNAEQRDFEKI